MYNHILYIYLTHIRMKGLKITKNITNRDIPSLDKYLQEIGKIKLITQEEEIQLAQRIKQGDQQAVEKLVKANLRFVVSVAKQYQNSWLSLSDLINEGNFWLIKAAEKFDETRGFKFISYAVRWVRQSILGALEKTWQMIRIPRGEITVNNTIKKSIAALEKTLSREPSPAEIAEYTQIPIEELTDNRLYGMSFSSLDKPIGDNEDTNLSDMLVSKNKDTDYDIAYLESLRIELTRALKILSPGERQIVEIRYWIWCQSLNQRQIAEKLKISQSVVKSTLDKAIRILKYKDKHQSLKQFL